MKFNFGADANADAGVETTDDDAPSGKLWLDLFGKLSLGVNNLAAEMRDARVREQEELRHVPINIPIIQQFPRNNGEAAAVTAILDFGSPQPGREWIVRKLSVVAKPLAANATVVTWYVGQNVPVETAGMLPPAMAEWQFPSVPGFEKFTSDVIRIMPNEHLLAGLTGIPGSSNLVFKATILDQLLNDSGRRERV